MKEPVVFLPDLPNVAFNRDAVMQYLADNRPNDGATDEVEEKAVFEEGPLHGRTAEELIESYTASRLVRAYAPISECLVMELVDKQIVPLSRDQFPSWTALRTYCGTEAAQCMRLLSALSLKSCRCPPKLTKTKEGVVVVFTGHRKAAAGSAVIFSPSLGGEEHMDLDLAAKNLSEVGGSFDAEAQNKEVREGIIVCLDVSDSMGLHSSFEEDQETGLGEGSSDEEEEPSNDSEEARQCHLKRFALQPGMAHVRQMIQQRSGLRERAVFASAVLRDFAVLAQVTGRGSPEDARRLVKYKEEFAKTLLEQGDDDPPPEFCCPITRGLMKNAVCAPDGFTYEADAIAEWFCRAKTSPMTGQQLTDTTLIPNHVLRSQTQDWRECHAEPKSTRPAASEEEKLHVVCYMRQGPREMVELELPGTATAASLKQELRAFTGMHPARHLVYHSGNLLPELVPLRTAGVCDGSPLEVLTSNLFTSWTELVRIVHRQQVRVLVRSQHSSRVVELEVAAWELVISLKCRIWASLPRYEQTGCGASKLDLWHNLHEAS